MGPSTVPGIFEALALNTTSQLKAAIYALPGCENSQTLKKHQYRGKSARRNSKSTHFRRVEKHPLGFNTTIINELCYYWQPLATLGFIPRTLQANNNFAEILLVTISTQRLGQDVEQLTRSPTKIQVLLRKWTNKLYAKTFKSRIRSKQHTPPSFQTPCPITYSTRWQPFASH